MSRRLDLSSKQLFLFDLDGVFYKGKEKRIKIGGTKIVKELRKRKKKLLVLTNNSTDSTETVWSRLVETGVPVRRDEILTSSVVTAQYLRSKYGRVSYFLVGERGLETEMRRLGHRRVNGDRADFVVVGLDRHLSYDKLNQATTVARNGAPIVATHISALYMARDGPSMATGPIVRALEYAASKKSIEVGKPATLMFKVALRDADCHARDAVMVGDQIDTDIKGAVRAGIDAILVKTGVDKDIRGTGAIASISNVDDLVRFL
ncbi:MAG TPA: HAD-IIA family hydrolase [Nitrososphaerales archaeon]|nr:HAD-IIA family hydrolase [Nitrososphaerales archaeon]